MQICQKDDAVGILYGSQPCQWLAMGCAIERQRAVGTQQI